MWYMIGPGSTKLRRVEFGWVGNSPKYVKGEIYSLCDLSDFFVHTPVNGFARSSLDGSKRVESAFHRLSIRCFQHRY